MVERIIYMQNFLRALVVGVLPSLLRLVAAQIEDIFQEGGEK